MYVEAIPIAFFWSWLLVLVSIDACGYAEVETFEDVPEALERSTSDEGT